MMKRFWEVPEAGARLLRAALFMLGLVAITGCAGMRTYPEDFAGRNLVIEFEADSEVRAILEVYRVDQVCRLHYRQAVRLDKELTALDIPADDRLLLMFALTPAGGDQGGGVIGHGSLITTRQGMVYKARVSYRDDEYDVEIFEADSLNARGSRIEHRKFSDCQYLHDK